MRLFVCPRFTGAAGEVHGGNREPGPLPGLLPELQEDVPRPPGPGGEDAGGRAGQAAGEQGQGGGGGGERGGEAGLGAAAAQRLRSSGAPPRVPGPLRPHARHPPPAPPRLATRLGAELRSAGRAPAGPRPRPRQPDGGPRPAGGAQGHRTVTGRLAGQREAREDAAALQAEPPTAGTAVPIAPPRGRGREGRGRDEELPNSDRHSHAG